MPGTKRNLETSSGSDRSSSSAISEPSSADALDETSISKDERVNIKALLASRDLAFGQSPTTVIKLTDGTPFELEKGEATKLLKLLTTRIKLIIASFPFTEATTEEEIISLYQNLDSTLEAIEKIYHWDKKKPPSSDQKNKTTRAIKKLKSAAAEGTEIVLHKFYPTIVEKKLESGDLILILHELDVLSKFVVLFKHGLPYLFNTSPVMDGYKKEECPLLDENYPTLIYTTCDFLLEKIERLKTDYPEVISEMVGKQITYIEENMDLFRQKLNAKEMRGLLKKQLPKEEPPTHRLEYRVEHGTVAEIAYEEILLDHFRDPTFLAKKTIRKLTENSKNIASFCESLSCNRDAMFRQCLELSPEDQEILLKNILDSGAISTALSPSALCDLATALPFNQNSVKKSELLNQLILRSQELVFLNQTESSHEKSHGHDLHNTLVIISLILSKKDLKLTKSQNEKLTEITVMAKTFVLNKETLEFLDKISTFVPSASAKKAKKASAATSASAEKVPLSPSKQQNMKRRAEDRPRTEVASSLFPGPKNDKENRTLERATASSPEPH